MFVFIITALFAKTYINAMDHKQPIKRLQLDQEAYYALQQLAKDGLPSEKKMKKRLKRLKQNKPKELARLEQIANDPNYQEETRDFESLLQETKKVFKFKKTLEELEETRTPKVIAHTIEQIEQIIPELANQETILEEIDFLVPRQSDLELEEDKALFLALEETIKQTKKGIQSAEDIKIKFYILRNDSTFDIARMRPENKKFLKQNKNPRDRLQYTEDLLNKVKQNISELDIKNYRYLDTLCMSFKNSMLKDFEMNKEESKENIKIMNKAANRRQSNKFKQHIEQKMALEQENIQQEKDYLQDLEEVASLINKKFDDIEESKKILNQFEQLMTSLQNKVQELNSAQQQSSQQGSCNICQKIATNQCAKCKQVFYCSKEHQIQDWKAHKTQCTQPMQTEKHFEVTYEGNQKFVVTDNQGTSYKVLNKYLKIKDNNGVIYIFQKNGPNLCYKNTKTQQKYYVEFYGEEKNVEEGEQLILSM